MAAAAAAAAAAAIGLTMNFPSGDGSVAWWKVVDPEAAAAVRRIRSSRAASDPPKAPIPLKSGNSGGQRGLAP